MAVNLDDVFASSIADSHQQGMAIVLMADKNLAQGLGVVNSSIIQQQGSLSSDPGLVAALQTASRAPAQGANEVSIPK